MPYAPILGQVIGCEFEVRNLTERGGSYLVGNAPKKLSNWRVHHDGSVLDKSYRVVGLSYPLKKVTTLPPNPSGMRRSIISPDQFGCEVVTPPIDTTTKGWQDGFKYFLEHMVNVYKEVPGLYTSFHVHVNARGLPLRSLQNAVALWMRLEAPIYRLSCGELRVHRGRDRKDFAYSRPLRSPLVVLSNGNQFRKTFDVDRLLAAQSVRQFFYGLGNIDISVDPTKYHPGRYVGFNVIPSNTIGTLELRTPNETVDFNLVMAWIELAQKLVQASLQKPFADDYPELPLGYAGDFSLTQMQVMLDLTDETMNTFEKYWRLSDWQAFDDSVLLFNSNNDNTTIEWPDVSDPVVPAPVTKGTVLRRYLRRSEQHFYHFTTPTGMANPREYLMKVNGEIVPATPNEEEPQATASPVSTQSDVIDDDLRRRISEARQTLRSTQQNNSRPTATRMPSATLTSSGTLTNNMLGGAWDGPLFASEDQPGEDR